MEVALRRTPRPFGDVGMNRVHRSADLIRQVFLRRWQTIQRAMNLLGEFHRELPNAEPSEILHLQILQVNARR
jgi:hypothetical protein